MLSTELRLGNWVEPHPNIANQPKGKVTQTYMNGFTVDYHYPGTWFKAIPITKEILLKCGAEPFGNGDLSLKNNLIHYAECRGVYIHTATSIELKFVHQLQNLFFALMGIEIEVAW